MIWDLSLIQRVRALRVDADLADEQFETANHPEALIQAHIDHMHDQLIGGGHTFGVEIHPGDINMATWVKHITHSAHYQIWWAPDTREIELRGGENDSQHWEVPDIHQPLKMPVRHVQDPLMGEPAPRYAHLISVTYMLAGWNEQNRYWIFDLQD